MRILAIADTHLGFKAGWTPTARETVYKHVFAAFEAVLKIAQSEKVDAVLHAGDLFNRSRPPRKVVSRAYGLIEKLLRDDVGFIVVAGNHDRSHLPPSLLKTFFENGNFLGRLAKINLGDISVIGFPYNGKTPGKTFKKVGKIAGSLGAIPCIVLCHQLFNGATYGPHQFRFTNRADVLHSSRLPEQVHLVITGHIHRAQALQGNRVVYPGSLERMSFAEAMEPKGYLLIDIASDGHQVEFHEISTIPMNVVEFDLQKNVLDFSWIEEELSKLSGRMMLRLTGRALSLKENNELFKAFPASEWPLLLIAPRSPGRMLKPLYDQAQKASFFEKVSFKRQSAI